jgi:ankyrin repeat protein
MKPLQSSLIKAAKNNDVDALEILSQEHGLSGVDAREQTLLFYAVKAQSYRVLNHLLSELDVNHANYKNETSLLIASRLGDVKAISRLLEAGADVRRSNDLKQTSLMLAAQKGSEESVKALIDAKVSINALDAMGESALFYAVRGRNKSIILHLINHGIHLYALNDQKNTIIHEIAHIGDVRLLDLMISKRVHPYGLNIHKQSPLHLATFKHHIEMVKALLDLGLEPELSDHFGMSSKKYALEVADLELSTLYEHLPLARKYVSYKLTYPLHHAIRTRHFDQAVVYIQKKRFDPLYDHYKKTPLFYAMMHQDAYLIDQLLSQGHPKDAFQESGISLVMQAMLYQKSSIFDVLKKYHMFDSLSDEEEAYLKNHPSIHTYLN